MILNILINYYQNMDTLELKNNKISQFAFIDPSAILGKGNVICEGAIIRKDVIIGDNNYIGPYCIIGEMPESKDFLKESTSKVRIGNSNYFFKQVTIDGGTTSETFVGNGCLLLKNSHVGHDAKLMNGVRLSCNASIGGWTVVNDNSIFGIGAVAHQRIVIPENVFIGINGVVTKKTELREAYVYGGVPVKEIRCNHDFEEVIIDCGAVQKKCKRCGICVG